MPPKYPQKAGIPVTGGFFDGPEWGEQPYTNMFASDAGSVDPKYPVNTDFSSFIKARGGSILGSYGYGISPTSVQGAVSAADAFKSEGGKVGVLDTSVPFGSVDFTSASLTAKQSNVNGVFAAMDGDSNVALATAFKQAGIKPKVVVFPTGYSPSLVNSPAWSNVQGDYFVSEVRPASLPNAGTRELTTALQKYEHRPPSQFYDYGIAEAWLGADLMLKGIQLAGADPTSAKVIHALRSVERVQRRRAAPSKYRLPHGLWPRSSQVVFVVPPGSEEWVRPGVDAAMVRARHSWHISGGCDRLKRRRR